MGLEGDSCAHPGIHGGQLQAVLLICSESIEELAAKGFRVFSGALGENLTAAGLDRRQMRPGQRYRIGEAVIELTKPREPCSTLDIYGQIHKEIYDQAVSHGDPSSPRWGLAGFYASVVQPGLIRQGDIIALLDQIV